MAHHASPADYAVSYANSPAPSRSSSPKFNIADFEQLRLPNAALTTATRETSYASQAAIDDLDFARTSQSSTPVSNRYSKNIRTSFLGRSASKLLPRAVATTNLPPTPPASQPGSGASSPTKSFSTFITNNTSTLSSSASKASVRAKTASKVLFDSYFHGNSNDLHIGVLQPHSRNSSVASAYASPREEDGYEPDCEIMATSSYTRTPVRTRPRRSPTIESTTSTYANKLGSWFGNNKQQTSPKPEITVSSRIEQDDPLVNMDVQQALFPYGPVDPLNPTSFNDLLAAAEAVIATYQTAYRQRVAELANIRSELALKDDEFEESETRAQHLKMQLQDLGEQCTAQTQKAELLEGMVRERSSSTSSSPLDCGCESRSQDGGRSHSRTGSGRTGSDSGFDSDGDSVFSAPVEQQQQEESIRRKGGELGVPQNPNVRLSMFSTDARRENELLRMRVAELESAVDGCLSLISQPWGAAA